MKDDGFGVFDRGLDGRSAHDLSLEILREYCKPGKRVLVAFSGGKDSQCIYHLCQEAGVEFTAQYSVTRFEPPELWEFVRRVYPDVRIRRAYRRSLFEDVVRRGPPTRWGRWCCDCKHAKTPGFDLNVVGVRAAESAVRAQMWGAFRRTPDGQSVVSPIFWWSDRMVWQYLEKRGVPHCRLYDEGWKRIGCVCCPLSPGQIRRHWERYPRWARFWERAIRAWVERTMRPRGFRRANGEPCDWAKGQADPAAEAVRRWRLSGQLARPVEEEGAVEETACMFEGSGFHAAGGEEGEQNS